MRIALTVGPLMRTLSVASVLCLALGAQSRADVSPATPAPAPAAAIVLSTDPAASSISYHMVHKLHKFDAISKKIEGKVKILPTGQAQIVVRAPVESFDSGNSNRDAHMKEVTQAAQFPQVEFKGLCDSCAMPATFPTTVDKMLKGELNFHGVKKSLELPVKLTYESPTLVKATAQLAVSLDEFKIERPSLMFAKVEDALKLDINIVMKQ